MTQSITIPAEQAAAMDDTIPQDNGAAIANSQTAKPKTRRKAAGFCSVSISAEAHKKIRLMAEQHGLSMGQMIEAKFSRDEKGESLHQQIAWAILTLLGAVLLAWLAITAYVKTPAPHANAQTPSASEPIDANKK